MYDLLWAVIGMVLTFCALWLRKVLGQLEELQRKQLKVEESANYWAAIADDLQRKIAEKAFRASPQAILDLQDRLTRVEQRVAENELEILDTVEKVSHRLADRERKRRTRSEEIPPDDHDEAPNDPGELLARARAAYPLPQLPLVGG